jgi:hypothetical protein
MERLLYVAAFSVSAFQSVRNMRCSLPIMGETVEVNVLAGAPSVTVTGSVTDPAKSKEGSNCDMILS